MKHHEILSRALVALAAVLAVATSGTTSCQSTTAPPPPFEARVRPAGDALDLLFVLNGTQGAGRFWEFFMNNESLLDVVFQPGEGRQRVVDLHAGVIDMDLGAGGYDIMTCDHPPTLGTLRGDMHCSHAEGTLDPPFVTHSVTRPNDGGSMDPNGTPAWIELECIASIGEYGCGFEQPLESLRLALTDRVEDGTNAGFFREGSLLTVVILSDEDDCSPLDPSFFDLERDDLAHGKVRCYANADLLVPVGPYADLLLAQRPPGRVMTAAWLTVPQGWDGDLEVLMPDPDLDWRTATEEDFEICTEWADGMYKSPRLAELMVLTGGEDLVWSMCDNTIIWENGMETIGRRILERLDPVACLPSAPPEGSRCEVTLRPLDRAEPCPESTSTAAPGVCLLRSDQWELVETAECTELRATPEVEAPPGAALEIRCTTE